jgi:hypothetical protein
VPHRMDSSPVRGQRVASGKRIDDLADLTVQGIWEAHLKGGLAPEFVVDDVAVLAAGVLAERGYWTWMFQAATEVLTSWEDLHGNYWVVDPNNGYIWEWGTI